MFHHCAGVVWLGAWLTACGVGGDVSDISDDEANAGGIVDTAASGVKREHGQLGSNIQDGRAHQRPRLGDAGDAEVMAALGDGIAEEEKHGGVVAPSGNRPNRLNASFRDVNDDGLGIPLEAEHLQSWLRIYAQCNRTWHPSVVTELWRNSRANWIDLFFFSEI